MKLSTNSSHISSLSQSRNQLSVPITESGELNGPLSIYQSLGICLGTTKPYKCHLKDKAKYKSVAGNPNNIVAASWPLHQMLDGLNNQDNMSFAKLSILSASDATIATMDNRYAVTLELRFFHTVDALAFQARTDANRRDDRTWETTVDVKDKDEFAGFDEWKGNDTQRQWDEYNSMLVNM